MPMTLPRPSQGHPHLIRLSFLPHFTVTGKALGDEMTGAEAKRLGIQLSQGFGSGGLSSSADDGFRLVVAARLEHPTFDFDGNSALQELDLDQERQLFTAPQDL